MSIPLKGHADYYAEGDWNAICAVCGRKGKASEMYKIPQGLPGAGMRAHDYHEAFKHRHPQDFVRGIPDNQAAPWVQPPGVDTFILYCTPNGRTAIAEYAVADCAICDFIDPAFDSTGD